MAEHCRRAHSAFSKSRHGRFDVTGTAKVPMINSRDYRNLTRPFFPVPVSHNIVCRHASDEIIWISH